MTALPLGRVRFSISLFIAIVDLFPSSTKSFIFIAMSLPYLNFFSNVFLPKILIYRFERSGFFMCDISNLLIF